MRGTRPCRILPLALALTCALATSAQNVGISTNGVAPATDALLDINAASLAANAKRGLLIPRMTEAQRLAIPVTVADNALLVYQTDVGAALDTTNARGLWYYDAPSTAWRIIVPQEPEGQRDCTPTGLRGLGNRRTRH